MSALRELLLTIVGNARNLPLGVKMLAVAFSLVFGMELVGVANRAAWSIALASVLTFGCASKLFYKADDTS